MPAISICSPGVDLHRNHNDVKAHLYNISFQLVPFGNFFFEKMRGLCGQSKAMKPKILHRSVDSKQLTVYTLLHCGFGYAPLTKCNIQVRSRGHGAHYVRLIHSNGCWELRKQPITADLRSEAHSKSSASHATYLQFRV